MQRLADAPDALRLANPLVAEESILRTSLLPGLLKAVGHNAAHRSVGVTLYEHGHCFAQALDGGLPQEWEEFAVVLAGRDAVAAVALARGIAESLGVTGVAEVLGEIGVGVVKSLETGPGVGISQVQGGYHQACGRANGE